MLKHLALAGLVLIASSTLAKADPADAKMHYLHALCSQGNRGACIKFGIEIGRHQERAAEWHQTHPDWFWYEH